MTTRAERRQLERREKERWRRHVRQVWRFRDEDDVECIAVRRAHHSPDKHDTFTDLNRRRARADIKVERQRRDFDEEHD